MSVASARDAIDARYAEPFDVPALARVAGLSLAHFSLKAGALAPVLVEFFGDAAGDRP